MAKSRFFASHSLQHGWNLEPFVSLSALYMLSLFCYSTLYRKRQKLDRASKAADKSTNSKHDKSNSNNNTTSAASAEIDEIDSADEMEAPTLEEQVRVYV